MMKLVLLVALSAVALSQGAANMVPQTMSLLRQYGLEPVAHPSGAGTQGSRCHEKVAEHVKNLCGGRCTVENDLLQSACSAPISEQEIVERCCPVSSMNARSLEAVGVPAQPKFQRRLCGRKLVRFASIICPQGCDAGLPAAGFLEEACSVGVTAETMVEACCPSNLF